MTEFEQWYYGVDDDDPGYVRKEARGDAEKAFTQARRKVSLEELIAGRHKYAKQVVATERRFIKLPASWLRAECWADEYEPDPNPFSERLTATEALERNNVVKLKGF